jgi:hypothetical protein
MIGWYVNDDEMYTTGKKLSWPNFKVPYWHSSEGTEKNHEAISMAGRQGRDCNPGPPEYETGMLTTCPPRSLRHSEQLLDPQNAYSSTKVHCIRRRTQSTQCHENAVSLLGNDVIARRPAEQTAGLVLGSHSHGFATFSRMYCTCIWLVGSATSAVRVCILVGSFRSLFSFHIYDAYAKEKPNGERKIRFRRKYPGVRIPDSYTILRLLKKCVQLGLSYTRHPLGWMHTVSSIK